jgi:hypothetical protein
MVWSTYGRTDGQLNLVESSYGAEAPRGYKFRELVSNIRLEHTGMSKPTTHRPRLILLHATCAYFFAFGILF